MTAEEFCCAAILAFFAIQGAIPFIAPSQSLGVTGEAPTGWMFYGGIGSQLVVYGAIAFLLLRQAARVARWLRAMQWSLALSALAVASTMWSQFPLYTIRRSLPFAFAGIFGLYLAMRFSVSQQLKIIRVMLTCLAVASVVMVVAYPQIGLDASVGHHANWQGVFTQKNTCGQMMVLASASLMAAWRPTWQRITMGALFLLVLVMSGSRSAWLVEGAMIALWCGLLLIRRMDAPSRMITMLLAVSMLPMAVGAGYLSFPVVAAMIGRDPTLSGRTEVWKQAWIFIQQRPWLGWGYEAFWRGIEGAAFRVAATLRFVPVHAHNGFLEIWLELGIAGLVLFALSYLRAWRRVWPALRAGEVDRTMWMVFVLTLVLLYDLDENTLLTYNGLFWVLYVSALANVEFLAVEDSLCRRIASFQEGSVHAACAVVSQ